MILTPEILDKLRDKSSPSRFADAIDSRAKELDTNDRKSFIEKGLLCCEVEDSKLWAHMEGQYETASEWISSAFPESESSARQAKSVFRKMRDHAPFERLQRMKRSNLVALSDCSDIVKADPEMWEKARILKHKEFLKVLNVEKLQHIPETNPYNLHPTDEQQKVFDMAIDAVRKSHDVNDMPREDCLTEICACYLETVEESDSVAIAAQMETAGETVQ